LGCSGGQLNDEMEFTTFDSALADGEDLATEGMVRSRNTNSLDVTGIQPRSMLVVVLSEANELVILPGAIGRRIVQCGGVCMSVSDRTHLANLLTIHRRNLEILEAQAAQFGGVAPLHIVNQLNSTKAEIARLEAQLGISSGPAQAIGSGNRADTSAPASVASVAQTAPPPPAHVTLRFQPTKNGATITWEGFAVGRAVSKFTMPYRVQELPIIMKALDAAQHPGHPLMGPRFSDDERQLLESLGLWRADRVRPDVHRLVGKKLYDALTRNSEGKTALKLVRENARSQGQPLSYVLRFPPDAVELASLPWEALWDERQPILLSRGGSELDSCERYLDLPEALSPPLPSGTKLHILALAPHAGIPDDVRQEERAARMKSWETLKGKGLIDWDELSPVTTTSLNNRLRTGPRPDIVHYYGHGTYKDGQGYLLFDSAETPGRSRWVDASRLAAQLGGIRLIMLHACQSAMVEDPVRQGGLLTGVAPALSAVSEAVVAMQLTVRIAAATRFSEVFYEEIAGGRSLQAAVAEARRAVYLDEEDGASWYVPTLYIRTRDQQPVYVVQVADPSGRTSR
jgi:hypothetical protein